MEVSTNWPRSARRHEWAGKLAGVAPEAAGHVEDARAGAEREHAGREVDLRPRALPVRGGPVRGEVGRVEEAPEPLPRDRHRPTPAPGIPARACSRLRAL